MSRSFSALRMACCIGFLTAMPTLSRAGTYRQVYAFQAGADGAFPVANVIGEGGMLYGTTASGGVAGLGTVFALNPTTGVNTTVHSFGGSGDGIAPVAGLISVGATFYGTTEYGGSGGGGTVFALDQATGAERVAASFRYAKRVKFEFGPMAALTQVHGKLYGTTADEPGYHIHKGSVFSFDPSTGIKKFVYYFKSGSDGMAPLGSLLDVGGMLYGTTASGGGAPACTIHCGTVFALNRKTGVEKVVYSFKGDSDGHRPVSGLTYAEGYLYGTSKFGGASRSCRHGCGTVFSINLATGAEAIIHSFRGGDDGAYPAAGLTKVGGRFYSTTLAGGRSKACEEGCGVIFSVDPKTGDERVDHAFQGGADGAWPWAGLTNYGGTLYGTTQDGGLYGTNCRSQTGCGTVFAYTP